LLKLLAKSIREYKTASILSPLFVIMEVVLECLIPLVIVWLGDAIKNGVTMWVSTGASIKTLGIGQYAIILLAMAFASLACGALAGAFCAKASAGFAKNLRKDLYYKVQEFSFENVDKFSTSSLVTRMTTDVTNVQFSYMMIVRMAFRCPVMLIFSVVMAFIIGGSLAWIFIAVIPPLTLILILIMYKVMPLFHRVFKKYDNLNESVQENIKGIRVVKSFANENVEMKKFKAGNDNFVNAKKVSYRYMGIYNSGLGAMTTLVTVAVLTSGVGMMLSGSVALTDLITFLLYINNFTDPVKKLVSFTEQFQNGYSGFERFLEILAIAPDIADKPDAVSLEDVEGDIEFKNVSFHYEDTSEQVLSAINLEVKAGEYVALVGPSGVGKTTLLSLIPRFYEVSEGCILIDGTDIRDIRLESLRSQIGIVQQDVYLFAGNIMDNIRYGRPEASDAEVVRAAKRANAHEFIMSFPDGYDTDIGQRGVKLSGGQKQRLSIARVFLKNPPVLIFDEATSALDNESEQVVQRSLESLAKNRTTFVIAHRLTTIRNAEKILVLTEKGIAEQGTHEELLKQKGIYEALYHMHF